MADKVYELRHAVERGEQHCVFSVRRLDRPHSAKRRENGDIKEVALDQMQRYTADETFKYVQDMLMAHPDLHGTFVQTVRSSQRCMPRRGSGALCSFVLGSRAAGRVFNPAPGR